MFRSERWAEAFAASAKTTEAAETALEYLRLFCLAALRLPGDLSGTNDANRLGASIKRVRARVPEHENKSCDLAEHFVELMLKKDCFRHYKKILRQIEKIIYKRKGIEEVFVESAVPPDEQLAAMINEKAKRVTGAAGVQLTVHVVPELIGGLRLRWGSKLLDGSVRGALESMALKLNTEAVTR